MTALEVIRSALDNNAHGPLREFGECPACDATKALRQIEDVLTNVPDHPPTDAEYLEWMTRRWAVVNGE